MSYSCRHDEASPHYVEMLDNTAAGHRWISQTFGAAALPRVTSQLDPFGHSATQAALFASPVSGFIATYHARMDWEEVRLRRSTRTTDFAWAPSTSLGYSAMTLGSLGGYGPPGGFCFDIGVQCEISQASGGPLNNPINDDAQRGLPDAIGDNVLAFVAQMNTTVRNALGEYPADADGTVNIPIFMGDDFDFTAAHYNFGAMDKLIHYVNLNTSTHGINVFYSTQAEYAAVRLAADTPLTLKTSDAFPCEFFFVLFI